MADQGRSPSAAGVTFAERYVEAIRHTDDMYTLYQHLDICLPMVKELDRAHAMKAGPIGFQDRRLRPLGHFSVPIS